MLHLARAYAEGECAEGPVGGGVRVAADDGHAGLGDAQLGADHMHDALPRGADRVGRDAELLAVALERLHLNSAQMVRDLGRHGGAVGGHVVVGSRKGAIRATDLAAGKPETVEGLRRGDLVHEVQVDVEQAGCYLVGLPDLVEQRLGHVSGS